MIILILAIWSIAWRSKFQTLIIFLWDFDKSAGDAELYNRIIGSIGFNSLGKKSILNAWDDGNAFIYGLAAHVVQGTNSQQIIPFMLSSIFYPQFSVCPLSVDENIWVNRAIIAQYIAYSGTFIWRTSTRRTGRRT